MHGIDEGGLETGPSATAPVLYSTGLLVLLAGIFPPESLNSFKSGYLQIKR